MADDLTPEQARDTVAAITRGLKDSDGRIGNVEKAITDLQRAQAAAFDGLTASQRAAWNAPTGGSIEEFLINVSDPSQGLRMADAEGVISVPELGINERGTLPGFLSSRPVNDEHAAFQRAVENYQWMRAVAELGKPLPQARIAIAQAFRALPVAWQKAVAATIGKRSDSVWGIHSRAFGDSSAVGAEWIPDTFIPTLYRPFEVASLEIDGIYDVININGPVTIPTGTSGGLRPYMGDKLPYDDPAAITASSVPTGNVTIDVSPMMVRYVANATALEDGAGFVVSQAQMEIMRALRDGRADRWINGDSAATHQDTVASWNIRSRWGASGLGGSADHRRSTVAQGRAHAFDAAATSDQSATSTGTVDVILNTAALMGEFSADELVVYMSPEKVLDLLADSRVVTVDAFGEDASIKVGIRGLGRIFGSMRVVMTRWLEPTMAATGLYTGSGAYDSILIVSRSAWKLINRRGPVAEVETERRRNAIHFIGSSRQDMHRPGYSATDKIAAVAFKI